VYRLLLGEQRNQLRQVPAIRASAQRMSQAVELIRETYDKLYITRLAKKFGMSLSGFHQHSKSATAMSPLQFQKQLRLQEARRLLVADDTMRRRPRTVSATTIRRTSAASTSACSASRRCVTSVDFERRPELARRG
jgi:AraC-like DNA-binding protein